MHIAITIPSLTGGGAERSVLRMARGLIERGHAVDIVLFRPDVHFPNEIHKQLRIFSLDNAPDDYTRNVANHILDEIIFLHPSDRENTLFFRFRMLSRLIKALNWRAFSFLRARVFRRAVAIACYIDQEKPDCVVANLPHAKITTLLARHLTSVHAPPIIAVVRCALQSNLQRIQFRYGLLFWEADCIVAISDGVADSLSSLQGVTRENIVTIYNPVVTPEIHRLAASTPEHPWLSSDGPPVVLAAGRLTRQKDFPTLLKAFARASSCTTARLIIIGEGSEKTSLETLIRELGIETRVSFAGWVANPFSFMARADLFVLSSEFEGLGNVLIEALACGCPVVSTDCPAGPSEILMNGKMGPLVPVGDVEALANAMLRVLENPPDKNLLQRRASDFSFDKSVDLYEKLIVQTVAS